MIRSISIEKIIETHDKIIEKLGGEKGVLNRGIIENAISRIRYPIYSNLKNNIIYASAVLFQAIILEHPFIDGNKRTGLAVVEDLLGA
ncbi:MAG: type II toxin-antitoxin system death-on-curing family toxin [Methanosarcinales archaeon]